MQSRLLCRARLVYFFALLFVLLRLDKRICERFIHGGKREPGAFCTRCLQCRSGWHTPGRWRTGPVSYTHLLRASCAVCTKLGAAPTAGAFASSRAAFIFNRLPALTWNWLKMNAARLEANAPAVGAAPSFVQTAQMCIRDSPWPGPSDEGLVYRGPC